MKTLYVMKSYFALLEMPDEASKEEIRDAAMRLPPEQYSLEGTVVTDDKGDEVLEIE